MYLSKLLLNSGDRYARRDLASPYELHRTLWRAFPNDDPGRILFRTDSDRSGSHSIVLVQSDLEPDWTRLTDLGRSYLLAGPEHKPFQPKFAASQRLRFRLRANPTKKIGTTSKAERLAGMKDHGQRSALLHEEEQLSWLIRKGDQGGFRIPGEWIEGRDKRQVPNFRVDVVPEGWIRCGKESHGEGRFYAVRFDGILEVTAPERFLKTVANGIGSAKGFGFGLLSLAPASC
jgi:CRISPR system Cascade subunit CasE